MSKQMLPVYNKPMIFYPLQTLLDMGVDEILIIAANELQCNIYKNLFIDEPLNITFKIQDSPKGIPEAFIIGEEFIGDDDVVLILGDNVFIHSGDLEKAETNTIFSYNVSNPQDYGVITTYTSYSGQRRIEQIIEKPTEFVSNDAVVGLYAFSNEVVELAKTLKPSARGELEIVDLIKLVDNNAHIPLFVEQLDGHWFDCGSHDSLLECANVVSAIESRTSLTVGYEA